jgi:hypothetical protein
MNTATKLLFVLIIGMTFTSCKDKESPEILIVAPADDAHFAEGTYFSYEIIVKDDKGLSQIREYIGDENGVSSNKIVSSSTTTPDGKRQKKYTSTTGYDLSTGISGEYYIWVEASDHSGKSKKAFKRFYVDP